MASNAPRPSDAGSMDSGADAMIGSGGMGGTAGEGDAATDAGPMSDPPLGADALPVDPPLRVHPLRAAA